MAAALLLAALWALLPVQLNHATDAGSIDGCFTRADQAPAGDPATEIPLLERCVDSVSTDADLAADLGAAYAAAGRDADAERAYRRALAIDPDFADVHLKLAEQLLRHGSTADAQTYIDAALKIQPNQRVARQLRDRIAATQ